MLNFRPLWRCWVELMPFAWFRRKRDFSLYKGNLRDFEGKMSGSSQNFNRYNFLLIFFWKYSQKCCFGVNFRCFGPFLTDLEHILGQKVAFPLQFYKGKIPFSGHTYTHENGHRIAKRHYIIFTFRKKFWIAE